MGADYREKVIGFIQSRGPAVPMQLGKFMGMNSMLAGAMLSELSGKGALKISHLKVGGSPLYFVPGQEVELLKFVEYLQPPEREAVVMLEREKVLRDNTLSPMHRTALRNVLDFAIPLDVTFNQQKETFWRWCVLPDDETEKRIRSMLQPRAPEPVRPEPSRVEPRRPEPIAQQAPAQKPKVIRPAPQMQVTQETLSDVSSEPEEIQLPSSKSADPGDPSSDEFLASLLSFFGRNNIKIVEQHCLKKRTEYDFVLKLPSGVGELTYYCKAKAKKKVAESDVSAAYVQGQLRKLPVLLLSPGELAKKAQELVERDLKGLTFKQMEGEP